MLNLAVIVALAATAAAQDAATTTVGRQEPTRAPTRVEPTREPTRVEPTREPTRVEPTREPTRVEPTREPTRNEPTRETWTQLTRPNEPTRTRPEGEPTLTRPGEPTRTRPEGEPTRPGEPTRTRPAGEPTRTRPIGDGNVRGDLPECQNLCTLESCRGSTLADCRTACNAKVTACQQAAAAALRQRVADANDEFKQRVIDARANVADIDRLDGADVKDKCDKICDARAGDRAAACKIVCAKAEAATGTPETRREAFNGALKVAIAAARDRFNNIVKANSDVNTQPVRDALDNLKDAVAQRRALLTQQQSDLADKLDALIAKWKEERQGRQDKIAAARALFKEFKDKLDAATTEEERAKIRADGRAAVQKAIDDAKASNQITRKRWANKIVNTVKEAHSDRRAARRLVICEFKNLKTTIENVRAGAKDIDPAAEVAESTGERKRDTTVTVVVSCEQADESCGVALNNVIAGAVDSTSDVTYTETSADEIEFESPVITEDEKKNDVPAGAATLMVGAAATVYAMMIALF